MTTFNITLHALAMLALFTLSGCVGYESDDSVGLCYKDTGGYIETSCSNGNVAGSCAVAGPGYSWFGEYDSFTECSEAADNAWGSPGSANPNPPAAATCEYTNDGECDEGIYCDYGTDTADCQASPPPSQPSEPPAPTEPDNACWSGLHADGRNCVVARTEQGLSLGGTPEAKLYLENTCSGRVYGKFCNERADGTWDCGADGIRGGATKVWSTLNPTGASWFIFTGSNEWTEDWVCSSEAGISNAEP